MSQLSSTRILPEALRSINSSTFTGSYQTVGTAFANPIRIMKITNNSTKDVTVSWDGTNDHDYVPAGSFVLIDVCTNRDENSSAGALFIALGTQIYVKGSAGTGSVYLSCYYGV